MEYILLFILLISLIEYIGDSNFKFYARNSRYHNLITGSIAYIALIALLIYVLKYTNVMYVNGMWDGVSAITGCLLAFILLKERLSTPTQYIGLFLIISGILTLNIGPVPK